MSSDDLSQLSLPQIAQAVASGELKLPEAEAELRRRPQEDRGRRRPVPRARTAPPSTREDLRKALEETRKELRQTTRQLAHLGQRLETLARMASALDAAPPTETVAPAASPLPRPAHILLDRRPEDDLVDDEAA